MELGLPARTNAEMEKETDSGDAKALTEPKISIGTGKDEHKEAQGPRKEQAPNFTHGMIQNRVSTLRDLPSSGKLEDRRKHNSMSSTVAQGKQVLDRHPSSVSQSSSHPFIRSKASISTKHSSRDPNQSVIPLESRSRYGYAFRHQPTQIPTTLPGPALPPPFLPIPLRHQVSL